MSSASATPSYSQNDLSIFSPEVIIVLMQNMRPVTRCAFALTCKRLATIASQNKCLEIAFAERNSLGQTDCFFKDLRIQVCRSREGSPNCCETAVSWYDDSKKEIEAQGGIFTQGIADAISLWWFKELLDVKLRERSRSSYSC